MATNQGCRGLIPCEQLHYKFLYYFLTSSIRLLNDLGTGTTFKELSASKLKSVSIPLPPLPKQNLIVEILDKAFAAIDTATANTKNNLANARKVFLSTLQSTFSQQGEEWKDYTLKEMADDFGRGKSKHRPRNADFLYGGKYPFIQTGDIRNSEHIIFSYTQTYSEAGLNQSKLWPKGTVCITIAANIAETGILGFDGCFPDSVIGMVPDPKKADSGYVEYLIRFFKTELQQRGKGSAQNNINLGTFTDQKFPFAPLPEQQSIAIKLDALFEKIKSLEEIYQRKIDFFTEFKKSFLHQAFTGQLTADPKTADRTLSEASV